MTLIWTPHFQAPQPSNFWAGAAWLPTSFWTIGVYVIQQYNIVSARIAGGTGVPPPLLFHLTPVLHMTLIWTPHFQAPQPSNFWAGAAWLPTSFWTIGVYVIQQYNIVSARIAGGTGVPPPLLFHLTPVLYMTLIWTPHFQVPQPSISGLEQLDSLLLFGQLEHCIWYIILS